MTGLNSVVFSCNFSYILDGERSLAIDVIEKVEYFELVGVLAFVYLLVFFDDLGKEHLTDSNHAAPSGVTDISAVDLVGEFGEAGAVGEPGS